LVEVGKWRISICGIETKEEKNIVQ